MYENRGVVTYQQDEWFEIMDGSFKSACSTAQKERPLYSYRKMPNGNLKESCNNGCPVESRPAENPQGSRVETTVVVCTGTWALGGVNSGRQQATWI
jgi:hypothetical protein